MPKNSGTKREDMISANEIDLLILLEICFSSFCATAFDISGTRAVEREPIKVVEMKRSGRVIPIATPYKLIACEFV